MRNKRDEVEMMWLNLPSAMAFLSSEERRRDSSWSAAFCSSTTVSVVPERMIYKTTVISSLHLQWYEALYVLQNHNGIDTVKSVCSNINVFHIQFEIVQNEIQI